MRGTGADWFGYETIRFQKCKTGDARQLEARNLRICEGANKFLPTLRLAHYAGAR
jgi:hypothetical protein